MTLPELQAIIEASREREHRRNKFAAALKGIDLDEGTKQSNEERFEEVQRRALVKLHGERAVDNSELMSLGFEVEIEE